MQLFKEILSQKSDVSCIRLMSVLGLFIAGYIAIRGLETHADLNGLAMLCGTFLASSFGAKVWQKSVETKTPTSTQKSEMENKK